MHNFQERMEKHGMEKKKQPGQQMVLMNLVFYLRRIKLTSYFSNGTKINSKWITDFNFK